MTTPQRRPRMPVLHQLINNLRRLRTSANFLQTLLFRRRRQQTRAACTNTMVVALPVQHSRRQPRHAATNLSLVFISDRRHHRRILGRSRIGLRRQLAQLVAAAILGKIQSLISSSQEIPTRIRGCWNNRASADTDTGRLAVTVRNVFDCQISNSSNKPPADHTRAEERRVRQNDHKFFAAISRAKVHRPENGGGKRPCDRSQAIVAS